MTLSETLKTDELIEKTIRYHASIMANKMQGSGLTQEDLIQEGHIAYFRAKKRYNPESMASLRTYVTPRIKGAMIDAARAFFWLGPTACRKQAEQFRMGEEIQRQEQLESTNAHKELFYTIDEAIIHKDLLEFAAKGLDEKARIIFYLRAVHEMSFKKIAPYVNLCEATIRQQWLKEISPYVASRMEAHLLAQDVSTRHSG